MPDATSLLKLRVRHVCSLEICLGHGLYSASSDKCSQYVICICSIEKNRLGVGIIDLITFPQKIWVNIFTRFC